MKIYGLISDFVPVRQDASRIVISFDLQRVDVEHCTWHEVCFYKKQNPSLSDEQIKSAVIADINRQTDMNIASGFVWNGKPVWLSMENQFNFKAACDKAVKKDGENLPVKFKLGQDANGNPVYHTFESVEELSGFVDLAEEYVHQCIIDGWARKDSVDWSEYEI